MNDLRTEEAMVDEKNEKRHKYIANILQSHSLLSSRPKINFIYSVLYFSLQYYALFYTMYSNFNDSSDILNQLLHFLYILISGNIPFSSTIECTYMVSCSFLAFFLLTLFVVYIIYNSLSYKLNNPYSIRFYTVFTMYLFPFLGSFLMGLFTVVLSQLSFYDSPVGFIVSIVGIIILVFDTYLISWYNSSSAFLLCLPFIQRTLKLSSMTNLIILSLNHAYRAILYSSFLFRITNIILQFMISMLFVYCVPYDFLLLNICVASFTFEISLYSLLITLYDLNKYMFYLYFPVSLILFILFYFILKLRILLARSFFKKIALGMPIEKNYDQLEFEVRMNPNFVGIERQYIFALGRRYRLLPESVKMSLRNHLNSTQDPVTQKFREILYISNDELHIQYNLDSMKKYEEYRHSFWNLLYSSNYEKLSKTIVKMGMEKYINSNKVHSPIPSELKSEKKLLDFIFLSPIFILAAIFIAYQVCVFVLHSYMENDISHFYSFTEIVIDLILFQEPLYVNNSYSSYIDSAYELWNELKTFDTKWVKKVLSTAVYNQTFEDIMTDLFDQIYKYFQDSGDKPTIDFHYSILKVIDEINLESDSLKHNEYFILLSKCRSISGKCLLISFFVMCIMNAVYILRRNYKLLKDYKCLKKIPKMIIRYISNIDDATSKSSTVKTETKILEWSYFVPILRSIALLTYCFIVVYFVESIFNVLYYDDIESILNNGIYFDKSCKAVLWISYYYIACQNSLSPPDNSTWRADSRIDFLYRNTESSSYSELFSSDLIRMLFNYMFNNFTRMDSKVSTTISEILPALKDVMHENRYNPLKLYLRSYLNTSYVLYLFSMCCLFICSSNNHFIHVLYEMEKIRAVMMKNKSAISASMDYKQDDLPIIFFVLDEKKTVKYATTKAKELYDLHEGSKVTRIKINNPVDYKNFMDTLDKKNVDQVTLKLADESELLVIPALFHPTKNNTVGYTIIQLPNELKDNDVVKYKDRNQFLDLYPSIFTFNQEVVQEVRLQNVLIIALKIVNIHECVTRRSANDIIRFFQCLTDRVRIICVDCGVNNIIKLNILNDRIIFIGIEPAKLSDQLLYKFTSELRCCVRDLANQFSLQNIYPCIVMKSEALANVSMIFQKFCYADIKGGAVQLIDEAFLHSDKDMVYFIGEDKEVKTGRLQNRSLIKSFFSRFKKIEFALFAFV